MQKITLVCLLLLVSACDNSSNVPAQPSQPENCRPIQEGEQNDKVDYVSNGISYTCEK